MNSLFVLVNKKTGEELQSDMFFINEQSDGGSVSLCALLEAVQADWVMVFNDKLKPSK